MTTSWKAVKVFIHTVKLVEDSFCLASCDEPATTHFYAANIAACQGEV
jgi:hypothetical protein